MSLSTAGGAHGAQINFGDLTPYYDITSGRERIQPRGGGAR
jgi:hypothetical protein